jgi:alpha-galactosidase
MRLTYTYILAIDSVYIMLFFPPLTEHCCCGYMRMCMCIYSMGYNTRFDVGCTSNLNAGTVQSIASSLNSTGLLAAGYNLITLDDCWQKSRGSDGSIIPDPIAFPSGIQSLVQSLNGQGIQLGLTTSRGPTTCGGRPGSLGYEVNDANSYVQWGVSTVIETSCSGTEDGNAASAEYGLMRDGLNATGKRVFFGLDEGAPWIAPLADSLGNSFQAAPLVNSWIGVLAAFDAANLGDFADFAFPGSLIDTGFILTTPALNENQTRTQVAQMAMLASPLILGSNPFDLSDHNIETLTNSEVLAVNQDPLVLAASLIWSSPEKTLAAGASQIWARPLVNGDWAVHFVNAADEPRDITCDKDCFSAMGGGIRPGWGVKVRDMWNTKDLEIGIISDPDFTVAGLIPAGGSFLARFTWQPLNSNAVPSALTPGDPHSVIQLDPTIQPRNHSTIPGWQKWVEQCGEFVYRYFHTRQK